MPPTGYLMMVLHAHLPFVRHPEHERFMEEEWLYEAITETYIPLLDVYNGLVRDGVDFRITMSLTPPLCQMLADGLLQERYVKHVDRMIELAEKEVVRTRTEPPVFRELAQFYLDEFLTCRRIFVDQYNGNLLQGFRELEDLGKLEILTCGATHGFQPLLQTHPEAVRAQIEVAVQSHVKHFGRPPKGIWNGECGYFPGLESYLKDHGIRHFFVDTHALLYASKRPRYGVFAPLFCENGVAAFGRDVDSSKSVWSAEEGYPGNPVYRDFYRDVGFDLDFDYVKPYIHPDGIRMMTGIKYYSVTGREAEEKMPYKWKLAREQSAHDAGNFMHNREQQINHLRGMMDRPPLIVSPYDAELYGHWWYEGPQFLNFLMRKLHFDQQNIKPITPSEYLDLFPVNQVAQPSFSSWGYKGYCEVWLEGSNDWIYRHLHKAAERMIALANQFKENTNPTLERMLNQAARELLLAQSSDWAFIMKTGTTVPYAIKRTRDHIGRFTQLYEQIMSNQADAEFLKDIEWKDNIFPEIDFRVYCSTR